MEYRIGIEEHGSLKTVYAHVTGLLSTAERDRIAAESVRIMRKHGIAKAIWDIREAELGYSLIESHLIMTNLGSRGVREGDAIAVIYALNPEHHEHASLAARNRGIMSIAYFRSLEEGIDWLKTRP